MKKIYTKGNVVVNEIKIGDIHYEFEYGFCVKSEVISEPVKEGEVWRWQSKKINSDKIINYAVNENYSHYGPNLYDYEAYVRTKMI